MKKIKDPEDRLSLEDVEAFFERNKSNKMITMKDIQIYKESSIHQDYFTWFKKNIAQMKDEIFDCKNFQAEQRFFSKSLKIYDDMVEVIQVKGGYVPAWYNIQENLIFSRKFSFLEKTDRCWKFALADNIVAALLLCLDDYGLLKNSNDDFLLESPRITAHIRRIIQFYIMPSQLYDSKPCNVAIVIQKVNGSFIKTDKMKCF